MDTVRFGRALGTGAREAAKALASAADAAASPSPSAKNPAVTRPPVSDRAAEFVRETARAQEQVRRTKKGVQEGGKRFGQAVWGPFAKLGGTLWLEVTGVFFALFSIVPAMQAWKDRTTLHSAGPHTHFWAALAMALVFGYFSVSSFVKANRRG